jgi:hypothetical protein
VAWLVIAAVLGLAGGLVLALMAGARRTDSAYDRFLETHDGADLFLVSGVPGVFDFAPLDLDAVAQRPEVAESARLQVLPTAGVTPDGTLLSPGSYNFGGDPDGRFGVAVDRFKLLEGRLADPRAPDEAVIAYATAVATGLEVGDTLQVNVLDQAELDTAFSGAFDEVTKPADLRPLRIVGVVAVPNGLPPASDPSVDLEFIYITPALLAENLDSPGVEAMTVKMRGGDASVAPFVAALQRDSGDLAVAATPSADEAVAVNRALGSLSGALLVGGLLAGAVTAVIVAQLLARQALVESTDLPSLAAIGMTRGDRLALHGMKALVIGGCGALVALATAIAMSPLFPIGLARVAEPDPGLDLDAVVIGFGTVGVLVLTVVLGVASASFGVSSSARAASTAPAALATPRAGPLATQLNALGRGPASLAGTSLTTGRRGSLGAIVGVGIGLVTVIGIVTFAASLDRLRDTPALYGWTWDAIIGGDFAEPIEPSAVEALAEDPAVRALEVGAFVELELEGRGVSALGIEPVAGRVAPALVSGREASGRNEIVLGAKHASDIAVGDTVTLALGDRSAEVEVVGRAALTGLEAVVPFSVVQELAPDTTPQLAVVRLAEGTDLDEFAPRAKEVLGLSGTVDDAVSRASVPADVENFGRVDAAPAAVAGLMALVALATLLHALLTAMQRGRRTLAVLRVVGFTRRQLVASVLSQAWLMVVAALVFAVPVGIAAGGAVWEAFAERLGVVAETAVPVAGVAASAVAALVVGALVAAPAGWRAARVSPAVALRGD